ncbi:leucine-rich repeat domain-containing protein [bacterium]|nr:leucine-rich repeat domain-containing protein [bacterium]
MESYKSASAIKTGLWCLVLQLIIIVTLSDYAFARSGYPIACETPSQDQTVTLEALAEKVALDYSTQNCEELYTRLYKLKELDLENKEIRDLSPLSTLVGLEKLILDNNNISDINPLEGLVGLKKLFLVSNQIKDISPLSGMVRLVYLYLDDNQIEDLYPLRRLPNLQYLFVAYNDIKSLFPLRSSYKLTWLIANNNAISDITPLRKLIYIKRLDLTYNPITNAASIAHFPNLDYFNLPKKVSYKAVKTVAPKESQETEYSVQQQENRVKQEEFKSSIQAPVDDGELQSEGSERVPISQYSRDGDEDNADTQNQKSYRYQPRKESQYVKKTGKSFIDNRSENRPTIKSDEETVQSGEHSSAVGGKNREGGIVSQRQDGVQKSGRTPKSTAVDVKTQISESPFQQETDLPEERKAQQVSENRADSSENNLTRSSRIQLPGHEAIPPGASLSTIEDAPSLKNRQERQISGRGTESSDQPHQVDQDKSALEESNRGNLLWPRLPDSQTGVEQEGKQKIQDSGETLPGKELHASLAPPEQQQPKEVLPEYYTRPYPELCKTPTEDQEHTLRILASKVGTDYSPDNCIELYKRLKKLIMLIIQGTNIKDISPLEPLTNVNWLFLYNNRISDISALRNFRSLKSLGLDHNQIEDISPLSNLKELTTLSLHNNRITDVAPLGGLKKLTSLSLHNNQINDISSLRELVNLTSLKLNNNSIQSISALEGLLNLSELHLKENQISRIDSLKNLVNLKKLDLRSNEIDDFSSIQHLANFDQFLISKKR